MPAGPLPARCPGRSPDRGEQGFTLIELLIVVMIIPLVMGAIAIVLITTLKDQTGVQGKLADAGDASASSAYYVRDTESASAVTTFSGASAPAPCSTAGLVGTPQFLLGLQLLGGQAVVSYYSLSPTAGGVSELVRLYCAGATTSRVVLSHNFDPAGSLTVVSCVSPPPANIPTGVTCTPASGWTPTYMVSNITLNVTQGCPTPPGPPCTPNQYSLTANPVAGVPVPPIVQTPGALTLLANNDDIQFQDILAGGTVCASGPILLKSQYGHGYAISGGRGDTVTSGSACGTSTSSGIDVYNCRNDGTSGSPCPTSGPNVPVEPGVAVSPAPVSAAQVNDPLSVWASQTGAPPVVTSPVHNSSNLSTDCTPTGSNSYTCPAGLYVNGLDIPDGKKVTFQGGATGTQFGPVAKRGDNCDCALTVGNSDTVFFGTGHYSYEGGLSMTGVLSALCAGPGTGQCAGAPSGGVFFYVGGGQIDFGSVSIFDFIPNSADLVQLSAISSASDPYNGKLLWQDQDNNAIELVGYLSASNSYAGTIYAPGSAIQVYGLGFSMSTGEIVANSLQVFSLLSGTSINVKCPSSGC